MLETLHISNYALIDTVDIRFYPGLDIITGETGAGKSIMLGALSLLLGARADTKAVRSADRKSVIEAVFTVDSYPQLSRVCAEADIDWDPQRCILRREIAPNGRSRAFVNDSPVPLTRLQEIALHLIDIHSQHNNQLLAQPAFQLQVVDTLAGNAVSRLSVRPYVSSKRPRPGSKGCATTRSSPAISCSSSTRPGCRAANWSSLKRTARCLAI